VYISHSERNKLKAQLDQYKESLKDPKSLVEKPLSTSEEDEFIKKLASEVTDQIRGVMSFTETPKLDYVINQALAGDTWYSKPDNDDTIAEDWFKGLINDLSDVEPAKKNQPTKADKLVKSKPLPTSSYIKKKNQIAPIYDDSHKCAIVETIGREVRMAERYAIQKGDSFEVNLQAWGHVKHTKQNPLWEVPGFCYLAAINIAIPCDKPWPANPTVQQMSRFGYKYRKLQSFKLIETIQGQHYTLKMGKPTTYRDNSGWRLIDYLAKNDKFYMRVGGDGDRTDVKTLDGTNYQQWAPKMKAYLMSKELWYYVNGETKRPACVDAPVPLVPERGSTTAGSSATAAYEAALKTYNEQREVQIVWDRADNKALGIIQLRMADKLQYLIRDTSLQSWANIKSQFDVSGPAAIFVDFKFVINFKFDDRKEPAVQVAELNTRLNRLATHGFNLDYRIQAMIILSGLPQSWDSVQGSILANHDMADLSISVIMPILQEEWQRRQARHGEHKSSHLARGGMHGAPQRQHWQGNQNNSGYTPQAGPSNYNSGYKPAPYKKFGKKPNYKPNNQNPGYNSNVSGSKGPNGPNWERNHQNRQNKKQARVLLKEQVAKLKSQSKTDTKGKKKEKAGKSANLLARIDDIPLESRMEDIDSYNERVLIAPKSNKTDVVKQIVDRMDVDNEDAVSLGNKSVYSNARDFYASNALDGDDWDKYGNGLLDKEFANLNHTVPIMVEMAEQSSSSSQRYSSNVVNTASCNKAVYTVNCVIKANEAKTSLLAEIGDDTWIIDSGASHHITTKLTDYTSYQPYPEPEIIQTANVHDSLKIHSEGTVFFNTETTNGQIHTVRLDNVCYIPNGSNRLLSQGQLCLEGLVEKADSKSTTFSLPTGRVFLRGFPRNETDTLHWVQSQIAHPNVPMAEPSLFLVNYNTWHLRMAHPSKNVLRHIGTNTNGFTPNLTFPLDSGICPGCAKGKMHNKPFPPSGKRAKQPFDLIHADLVQLPKKSYHKKEWACL
jgi:hypothetical protein